MPLPFTTDQDPDEAKENIAIVQAMYVDFARRDMAAVVARLADDVVWEDPENPWNPAAGGNAADTRASSIAHDSQRMGDEIPGVLRHLRRGRGVPARLIPEVTGPS